MMNIFKHRFLLLANFLEALPNERFSYRHWVGSDWKGHSDLSCGTTACAFGWAATIPELNDAGLMLTKSLNQGIVCMRDDANKDSPEASMRAASKIFDLNRDEFEYLFLPYEQMDDHYEYAEYYTTSEYYDESTNSCVRNYCNFPPMEDASAKEVAKHIRLFVKNKYKINE